MSSFFATMTYMKLLASSEQVDSAIQRMARDIVKELGNPRPLFVALLRGAAPFASKLMFELVRLQPELHPELDYMTVSTYGTGRKAGTPHIAMDISPSTDVTGRIVIILDDVLDKGVTSSFITNYLLDKGASHVKLAVLVEKDIERTSPTHADFACFHAGEEWLVGMGMDDSSATRDGYRWLNEIRII
jgi:hypoxanthine phosphoribosyltransferase